MANAFDGGGEYGPYIDGEEREGLTQIPVTDPSTNDDIATVWESGPERVDEAVASSRRAQAAWAARDARERGERLFALADAMREQATRLGKIETLENGQAGWLTTGRVHQAAEYIEYYAGLADKIQGETIPVPGQQLDYTRREPYGVVAQIVPWNAPLLLAARGFGPALAAGNTVVAKADPKTPLGLLELARIATDVGFPEGVINVLPGDVQQTGDPLIRHADVDAIGFTGSREGGAAVMEAAAANIRPVTLELGGKSPSLVFPDADPDEAVEAARNVFFNAGQACFATTRVFVHESIYDEFATALVDAVEALSVGPGTEGHEIGPLISPAAQDRVANYVDEAVDGGGRVLTGGEIPRATGNFYAPTVIDGVVDEAPISREEVFGPVITLYSFAAEDEAIERANDTDYGLYAAVWTNDLGRAHRCAAELEAGTVAVNDYPAIPSAAPFGGYKQSGLGREGGKQALDHYTQRKNVVVDVGD